MIRISRRLRNSFKCPSRYARLPCSHENAESLHGERGLGRKFDFAVGRFTLIFELIQITPQVESESAQLALTASMPLFDGHSPRASWTFRMSRGSGRPGGVWNVGAMAAPNGSD